MAFFCRLPWVQLLFPERTVMEVRSLFRPKGKLVCPEMSVAKFERLVQASGFSSEYTRYDCVHQMNWLAATPVRKLLVNRVSCVLT